MRYGGTVAANSFCWSSSTTTWRFVFDVVVVAVVATVARSRCPIFRRELNECSYERILTNEQNNDGLPEKLHAFTFSMRLCVMCVCVRRLRMFFFSDKFSFNLRWKFLVLIVLCFSWKFYNFVANLSSPWHPSPKNEKWWSCSVVIFETSTNYRKFVIGDFGYFCIIFVENFRETIRFHFWRSLRIVISEWIYFFALILVVIVSGGLF